MQAQPATFDTHAFVKRLTKVGMPESQAEILARGQSDLYERLVTKEYFESTLSHELEKLRTELKHDIETVKAELKHELEEHKASNRQALKELELTLTHNMKEMEQKLIIKLGALLGVSVTILAALIKFFIP